MELPVLKIDGSESGKKVVLDEKVFGVEPNDHAIYLDVSSTSPTSVRVLPRRRIVARTLIPPRSSVARRAAVARATVA